MVVCEPVLEGPRTWAARRDHLVVDRYQELREVEGREQNDRRESGPSRRRCGRARREREEERDDDDRNRDSHHDSTQRSTGPAHLHALRTRLERRPPAGSNMSRSRVHACGGFPVLVWVIPCRQPDNSLIDALTPRYSLRQ